MNSMSLKGLLHYLSSFVSPSPKVLICEVDSFTILRKDVVAVFQRGGSFPAFEAGGHSYLSLMGTP